MPKHLDRIIEAAERFEGCRFQMRHRSYDRTDCLGIVTMTGRDCGLTTWDTTDYGDVPDAKAMLRMMRHNFQEVNKRQMQTGDIAVFREPTFPFHLGLMDYRDPQQPWVIHVAEPRGGFYRERFGGHRVDQQRFAFRFPGIG
jgi:hypothetical protein